MADEVSLFDAHCDERCFLLVHVYDTDLSRPVALPLRSSKTPSGVELWAISGAPRRRIRACRPKSRILLRSSGHYVWREAMAWYESEGSLYVSGILGTKPLSKKVEDTADAMRIERATGDGAVVQNCNKNRQIADS